jgi:uncharacterized protein
MDGIASEIKKDNFSYKYDVFKNLSHYSLVAAAVPNSLYFVFDGFQPISKKEFNEKIVTLETGYAQYLIDKYDNFQKKTGLAVKPRYSDFKAIEAAILKNKVYNELENLGEYADKNYPKTILGTYHRGLYFEKIGQFKRAIKEYQKAFTQQEIGDLTKEYVLNRSEDLKYKKEETKDVPVEEIPAETPTEEPKKD